MADQEIKTGIDALVTYLNEHGETNISVIATALGVGEAAVLEWANVLEKAIIILISQKSGRLFLAPMTGAAKASRESAQAKQSSVQELISSDLAAVDQISLDLDEFMKSIGRIDDIFNTKYKNAKVMLDKLNGIDANMAKIEKDINARAEYIKTVSEKSKEQVATARGHLSVLLGFSLDTNNAKAVAQELRDLLKSYDRNTADLNKALDQTVYQYRKNALVLSKNIKEKHEQLVEVLSFDEKQIREYERVGEDYKREQASLQRQMDSIGKKTLEEIEAGKAEMARQIELSRVQMNAIRPRIDDIKKDLGQLAALNSQIASLRTGIDELVKQREGILPELRKLQQDVRTGDNMQAIEDRANKVSDSVNDIKGKVEVIRKDFESMGKKEK